MTIHIKIFSDYICPFCFIGKGIIDSLKQEFPIIEEWLPFEIHPETPPRGALLAEHLPHIDWDELYCQLRVTGAQYGIVFGDVRMLANSREALAASEYARDCGMHERMHQALFHAYFTECKNIGNRQVLLDLARDIGLDPKGLAAALDANSYQERLDRSAREAHRRGITGVPTFIINGSISIVGAQPLDVFRTMLARITCAKTSIGQSPPDQSQ
ncbi:MAG: DsbA family oxidoreductase [Desulfobacterota bacterium]|nr:DsbA family oxidoreductase [Thermodesulfobacteriota bacterium]